MSEYIVVVVWMLLIMFLSVIFNFYRKEYVLGQKVWRVTPFYALLAFLPIILYSGFRGNVGDSLLSSKIQKNLSEKWHFFKNAAFFDFFEVPVFSRNVANPNFA